MQNDDKPLKTEVRYSDQFKRDLKELSKHYRHIKSDIAPAIEKLETGEVLGDRLQGTAKKVYKLRIRNSDVKKGKSGGYRLIYYFQVQNRIYMIAIYSKSDLESLSIEEIKAIIKDLEVEEENEDE